MILVAEFDGPEGQNYRVTEKILSQLRDATEEYPDVRVEALEKPVTAQMGSNAARELGENRKASIIVWGWYGKTDTDVPISVNFEVLQPPTYLPPEFGDTASGAVQTFAISELNSFQLQTRLSSEMAYLTLFTLGMASYAAENWDEAIIRFDDALNQNQVSVASLGISRTHAFKGIVLAELGRYEEAIASYDKALATGYNYSAGLWWSRGIVQAELGRYEESLASYDKALEIEPDSLIFWGKGNMLSDLGRKLQNEGYEEEALAKLSEGIVSYDKALAMKPDFPEALHTKGDTLASLGRYDEAIASYDKVLAIYSDSPATLWGKRSVLAELRRYRVLYDKGIMLAILGRYGEAIASYDKALAIYPDSPATLYDKGVALGALKRYKEAIAAYDAALAIKPDDPFALNNKGVALRNLKRYEEAISAFDAALALNPDFPYLDNNKARVYALQGKVEPAIKNLDKAIQLNLDEYRELAKTNTDFDSIRDDPQFKALINSK